VIDHRHQHRWRGNTSEFLQSPHLSPCPVLAGHPVAGLLQPASWLEVMSALAMVARRHRGGLQAGNGWCALIGILLAMHIATSSGSTPAAQVSPTIQTRRGGWRHHRCHMTQFSQTLTDQPTLTPNQHAHPIPATFTPQLTIAPGGNFTAPEVARRPGLPGWANPDGFGTGSC
jgi:hypothetical protein